MSALRDIVAGIVEALVGPRLEARTLRRAEVVAQRGDGSLDIRFEGDALPPLTEVPIAYGVPGVRAKVRAGSVVFVELVEGDPSDPVVVGWAPGTVDELTVSADSVRLADGDLPLARRGDLVAVSLPPLVGSTVYSPIGVDPVAKAYGTIISGSASSKSK